MGIWCEFVHASAPSRALCVCVMSIAAPFLFLFPFLVLFFVLCTSCSVRFAVVQPLLPPPRFLFFFFFFFVVAVAVFLFLLIHFAPSTCCLLLHSTPAHALRWLLKPSSHVPPPVVNP